LREQGVVVRRVLLIGGAARSEAVRAVAPTVFGAPVTVPPSAEYVALGAARQAAWALAGGSTPPLWNLGEAVLRDDVDVEAGERVRAAYARARIALHG
jgi:xylulokinase